MTRISFLFCCKQEDYSIPSNTVNGLRMGALKLLGHWVLFCDSYFFGEKDLIKLKGMIESMISIEHNEELIKEFNSLKEIMQTVCKVRMSSSLGIPIPSFNTRSDRLQQFISRNSKNHIKSMMLSIDVKHIAGSSSVTNSDNDKNSNMSNGMVKNNETNKKNKMLEESIAKSNIEIFGMSSLLDDIDDDSDDEKIRSIQYNNNNNNDNSNINNTVVDDFLPIISEDFFLLIDPFVSSTDKEPYYLLLTRIHPLEIAKQITIVDHVNQTNICCYYFIFIHNSYNTFQIQIKSIIHK